MSGVQRLAGLLGRLGRQRAAQSPTAEQVEEAVKRTVEGCVIASELMQPILEATQGYREHCLRAGFNETAAEAMAMQFHMGLVAQAFAPRPS